MQHFVEKGKQVAFGAYIVIGSALFFYFVALALASMVSETFGGNPLPVLHIIGL